MLISEMQNPTGQGGVRNALTDTDDGTKLAPKPLHVQETIATLQRDFVSEALRIASIKAWHAADDLVLGDDPCAERGIRIAIANLREAATAYRQLETLTAAIDALGERAAS
jgi:hypothetical protein